MTNHYEPVRVTLRELEEQGLSGTCIRVREGEEGSPVYEGCVTHVSEEGLAILAYHEFHRNSFRNIDNREVYASEGSRIGIRQDGGWTICNIV